MTNSVPLDEEASPEKTGLSPFDLLTVPKGTILSAITQLATAVGLKGEGTDPDSWQAAARNTGTHTLKLMDSKIGSRNTDAWIFDPDPGCAPTTRALRTYAYDGKYSRLAKILLTRFLVESVNEPLALVDVLPEHSSRWSPEAREAFVGYFGPEALGGVERGLAERATASTVRSAAGLKARMIYVPDGEGGYVLVTPVMATDAFVTLTRIHQRMNERKAKIGLHRVKLSGKAQNVSLHAGARAGILTRLRASTPRPTLTQRAALWRFLASGSASLPPKRDIGGRLEAIVRLLSVMDGEGDRPGYVNAQIKEGLAGAVASLAVLAHEHVQDLLEESLRLIESDQSAGDRIHTSLSEALTSRQAQADLTSDLARQTILACARRAVRGQTETLADRTMASVLDVRVASLLERELKRLTQEDLQ